MKTTKLFHYALRTTHYALNSERGFFTLIGICILLVAAIFVKGIQESELNYAYIAGDFKTETELQNAADSALIEAVDLIKNETVTLEPPNWSNRSKNQHKIIDKTVDGTKVEVWYEYGKNFDGTGNFIFKQRNYSTKKDTKTGEQNKSGVILISVASRDSDVMTGKVFARAMGYIFTDGDELTLDKEGLPKNYVHFMNSVNKNFE